MSSTRRDNNQFVWTSTEGKVTIRGIIEQYVPQWPNGARSHQLESWVHTLERKSVVLVAPTGSGKTATFYGPILIMQKLLERPIEGPPPPPQHPVALVVTPLIELGNNQVTEITELGLRALALNAETLAQASVEGRNLYDEIGRCMWPVVLLSAERLVSPQLDAVIRNETFRKNLVLLGIDEAHVLVPWGVEFRPAYNRIKDLRKRLPENTPLVVVTATLAPGPAYESLCLALDLRVGEFHPIRLSCERPNVKTVILPLEHTLTGNVFPAIEWIFRPKTKAVIYCRTLDLGFRVACYGWSLFPPGEPRLSYVRLWSSLSSPSYNRKTVEIFHEQDSTCIAIATIAFGMGIHIPHIEYSINCGIPESCDALLQQNGRAGRDLVSKAFGITYVEPAVYSAIQASIAVKDAEAKAAEIVVAEAEGHSGTTELVNVEVEELSVREHPSRHEGSQSDSEAQAISKKSTAKKGKSSKSTKSRTRKSKSPVETQALSVHGKRTVERNLARLLCAAVEGKCLEVEKMMIYDGVGGKGVVKSCKEVTRLQPCGTCVPFSSPMDPPNSTPPPALPSSTPILKTGPRLYGPSLPPALNTDTRQHARNKLISFAQTQWSRKSSSEFAYIPHTAYWTFSQLTKILDSFHLLRSRTQLDEVVKDWKFLGSDGDALFSLVTMLNERYDSRLVRARAIKLKKAAATRARTAAAKAARQQSMSSTQRKEGMQRNRSSLGSKENIAPASILSASHFPSPPRTASKTIHFAQPLLPTTPVQPLHPLSYGPDTHNTTHPYEYYEYYRHQTYTTPTNTAYQYSPYQYPTPLPTPFAQPMYPPSKHHLEPETPSQSTKRPRRL